MISEWTAQWIALPLLAAAMLLGSIRAILGPSPFDRVATLDYLGAAGVGFLAALAVATGAPGVLDAAIPLSLLAFLSTLAFARHLESRK